MKQQPGSQGNVAVGVGVGVGVPVGVYVGVYVGVTVGVTVDVGVYVGVTVGVTVGVGVGFALPPGVRVGVTVGVGLQKSILSNFLALDFEILSIFDILTHKISLTLLTVGIYNNYTNSIQSCEGSKNISSVDNAYPTTLTISPVPDGCVCVKVPAVVLKYNTEP